MKITEEILTIKEVFEIIRNGFGLGELAETHRAHKLGVTEKKNDLISGNIRSNNNKLKTTENIEKLVKNLIDDYVDPLSEIISSKIIPSELILDEYKEQLNIFLKNIDKKITIINSICPVKDIQKHILLYLVSTQALKIYYEIKNNGKYNPSPKKEDNYIKYDDKRMLPFDIDGVPNSFHGIIEEKNLKLSELKDKNWKNWLNSDGSSMSTGSLLKEREDNLGEIEDFYVDCFFKRVQWKAFNELKKIEGLDKVIEMFPNIINRCSNLSENKSKDQSIDKIFEIIIEEASKTLEISDKKRIERGKRTLKNIIKLNEKIMYNFSNNSEIIIKTERLMNIFFKPYGLKDKICLKKLEKDSFHGDLMNIHREYNELKKDYSMKVHRDIYNNKIKKHKNSKNRYYKSYFNYFINDSVYLTENHLEEFKGPEKQNLKTFKQKFKNVSLYRTLNNSWNGEKINYLDYYLKSLLIEDSNVENKGDISPQFIEALTFLKKFCIDESFEEIQQEFIEYRKSVETLIGNSVLELGLEEKELKELLDATCKIKN